MDNTVRFRAAVSLLLISCILLLSSCEKTRGDDISDIMYDYGCAAVEIADDYLSGRITIEDAYTKIKANCNRQENHYNYECKEHGGTLIDTEISADWDVYIHTSFLYYAMNDKKNGTGVDAEIKEERDEIAKVLWK